MKRLLALFASSSGIELGTAELRAAIGAPAYDALAEAGVLVASPPATSVPCDEPWRGCGRDVVAADPGARCPWLGVCRSVEAPCPVRELSDDDLSRQRVDEHALCRLLAVALGVLEEDLAPPAGSGGSAGGGASGASGAELALLGVLRGAGAQRDVFLARRPGAWLADALVLRERSPRPSLVAVPTAGAIARPLLDRYLASEHVTLVVLEDALSVQRGRVVPRPRLVASSGGAGESRQGALGLPPISRFAEVTVRRVDGHTVRVVVRGKSVRLTYHDLGMASRQNREPTRAWAILMALCEGRGRFRYKDFGSFDTAKRQVSYLRAALRAAFACEDDPFPAFDPKEGWKPAFTASDEDPGDLPLSRLSRLAPTKDERPALGGPDPPSRVVGTALGFGYSRRLRRSGKRREPIG